MKKVERVELVLENCEVFEIRAEDIGFIDIKMDTNRFSISNGEVIEFDNHAIDVFFEVSKIFGTFVFAKDFVEGEDYVVDSNRLSYMDIVYLDFYYVDGSHSRIYVPFNTHLVPEESWKETNDLEHVLVTESAIYVLIGEGKIEDRVTGELTDTAHYRISSLCDEVEDVRHDVDSLRNVETDDLFTHVFTTGHFVTESFIRDVRRINLEDIKVGGRVAYVNRQGDVVAEYVTDISGEFVGLRSGNVIHHTKVTALVVG